MFSPNASGVGAINAVPTFAPTPLALGLNVKSPIRDRVRYKHFPEAVGEGSGGLRHGKLHLVHRLIRTDSDYLSRAASSNIPYTAKFGRVPFRDEFQFADIPSVELPNAPVFGSISSQFSSHQPRFGEHERRWRVIDRQIFLLQ